MPSLDDIITQAGQEWNVDPRLIKAVMLQESGGNPNAVSKAGALGLMQIMPATAKMLGMTDPMDPVQSVFAGAKYLSMGLDAEGTPQGAVAYYLGGPGWRNTPASAVSSYINGVAAHYKALGNSSAAPPTASPAAPQPSSAASGSSEQGSISPDG